MKIWQHQQAWFWFAAILIVAGATCFIAEDDAVQTVRRNQKPTDNEPKIARSQAELSQMNERQPVVMDQVQATSANLQRIPVSNEQEPTRLSISQFHNKDTSAIESSEIQQVTYPESQASRATLLAPEPTLFSPNIVRTSANEESSQSTRKPLVWFTGAIEKVRD